jgi:hypothetical protein
MLIQKASQTSVAIPSILEATHQGLTGLRGPSVVEDVEENPAHPVAHSPGRRTRLTPLVLKLFNRVKFSKSK